jgi:UDP-N-acetylmuramoyl-tripeptide--D-alanyl-D-alanine ligase
MIVWTADAVTTTLAIPAVGNMTFSHVSTDTRTLRDGALFVALRGERFDAHDFLGQARDQGATGAVVRMGTPPVKGLTLLEVHDPLEALGLLAKARRHMVSGPVVAVTGSNGKTSTKEMIASVLQANWRVHATRENLNNLVGVPLTILEAPDETEALVIEAGANQPGEIARLRSIIDPYVSVITNVADAHLEGFGSLEGVMREKLALVRGVPLAVVGTKPADLAARARSLAGRTVTAALDVFADVSPDSWSVGDRGHVTLMYRGHSVVLPVVGKHQATNAVIAIAVGVTIGVDAAAAVAALQSVTVPKGRCQLIEEGGLAILDDTYNANPSSLLAGLDAVRDIHYDRPVVVVVGSMLEMGAATERAHREMAQAIVNEQPGLIGAVGDFVPAFAAFREALGDRLITADTPQALGQAIRSRLNGNEFILLKASRGVGLERAIPFLLSDDEATCSTTS